ncbi:MAG: hypothetical protein ACREDT_13795 [Methylocella sp.]
MPEAGLAAGAAGPASGLTREPCKAGEPGGVSMLNGTELGYLDKHREGGFCPDAGDAGDAGDVEAKLQAWICIAKSREGGIDRRAPLTIVFGVA